MGIGLRPKHKLRRPERFEQDGNSSAPQSSTGASSSDFKKSDGSISETFIQVPPEADTPTILRTYTTLLDSSPICRKRQDQADKGNMNRPTAYRMDPKWAEIHARGARTDSRTLRPAAFPSLPLDQPPQAAAAQAPFMASNIVGLTESDQEEDTDQVPTIPTHPDEPNVLSDVSRKAIEYHFGQYPPQNMPVEDIVRAERQRMINDGILPNPHHPPKKKKRTCPKSEDVPSLQAKLEELTNKRKALEAKLRLLEYQTAALQASLQPSAADPLPDLPADLPVSIDSLWRTLQADRHLTHRLEMMENHARHVAKAKKRFFTRWPKPEPKTPVRKSAFRHGAEDTCLPAVGWRDDPDWHAMLAVSKKPQTQSESTQSGGTQHPDSLANWPRPWYMPRTETQSAPVVSNAEVTSEDFVITDNLHDTSAAAWNQNRRLQARQL